MKNLFRGRIGKSILAATFALVMVVGIIPNAANAQTSSLSTSQVDAIITLLQSFGADASTVANVQAALTGTPMTATGSDEVCGYNFAIDLSEGDSSIDVKNLQIVLNSDSDTVVATSGIGSTGNETEYFGNLTKQAVIKFQNKYASEVLSPVGLTSGTGYVGASTRAKLNTLFGVCPVVEEPVADEPVIEEPVVVNVAELSVDNPESGYVAKTAQNFTLMKVDFKGDDTVDQLIVEKKGFTGDGEINRVYLYKDGDRLTNGKGFNSDDIARFTNLDLEAPFTLSVVADLNGESGNIAKVELDGDYEGLPLVSNDFTFMNVDSGSVEITYSNFDDEDIIGEQSNVQVAEFKIAILDDDVDEAVFKHIELYNGGSATLSDVKITDGDTTWTGKVVDRKLIFDLNSTIDGSEKYEVYADVEGYGDETIELYIRNTYDVEVINKDYGFGMTVVIDDDDYTEITLGEVGEIEHVVAKSVSDDDIIVAYFGQEIENVAKFRFEVSDAEGFFIDELHFAGSDDLGANVESITISYVNKNGDTVTETEDVDDDDDVIFDSFSSSDRPYLTKDTKTSIFVGLELKNEEETDHINTDELINLVKFVATGEYSDEEITSGEDDIDAIDVTMRDDIYTLGAVATLPVNDTVKLEPAEDIEFLIAFANDDDTVSAFEADTEDTYIKLAYEFDADREWVGPGCTAFRCIGNYEYKTDFYPMVDEDGLEAEVYVNGDRIEQDTESRNILFTTTEDTIRLRLTEEDTLEVSDEELDIKLVFVGESNDIFDEFDSEEGDKFIVKVTDVAWTDNYLEEPDEDIVYANEPAVMSDYDNDIDLRFKYDSEI